MTDYTILDIKDSDFIEIKRDIQINKCNIDLLSLSMLLFLVYFTFILLKVEDYLKYIHA